MKKFLKTGNIFIIAIAVILTSCIIDRTRFGYNCRSYNTKLYVN